MGGEGIDARPCGLSGRRGRIFRAKSRGARAGVPNGGIVQEWRFRVNLAKDARGAAQFRPRSANGTVS